MDLFFRRIFFLRMDLLFFRCCIHFGDDSFGDDDSRRSCWCAAFSFLGGGAALAIHLVTSTLGI